MNLNLCLFPIFVCLLLTVCVGISDGSSSSDGGGSSSSDITDTAKALQNPDRATTVHDQVMIGEAQLARLETLRSNVLIAILAIMTFITGSGLVKSTLSDPFNTVTATLDTTRFLLRLFIILLAAFSVVVEILIARQK